VLPELLLSDKLLVDPQLRFDQPVVFIVKWLFCVATTIVLVYGGINAGALMFGLPPLGPPGAAVRYVGVIAFALSFLQPLTRSNRVAIHKMPANLNVYMVGIFYKDPHGFYKKR
jgi:hypothetical protein